MANRIEQLNRAIQDGISAVRDEDYLKGLNLLAEGYSGQVEAVLPDGLSYYALCIALVQRKFKPAIDLCKKSIELQFYNAAHYANLARVYVAAGNRKKAVETADQGLKILPDDETLLAVRRELGLRSRPPLPFLSRENPLNRKLGQARTTSKPEKPK